MRTAPFLASLFVAAAFAAPVPAAETNAAAPTDETDAVRAANVRTFTLGDFSALALRDGTISVPNDNKVFGVGHTPAEVAALLTQAGLPTDRLELSLQPLLVQTADRVMLFDSGAGANMGPGAGKLPVSLNAAGIAPATVTDIFISHAHGDHVGGLVDSSGALAFPNATIHMSAPEWAFLQGMTPANAAASGVGQHAALVAAITPKVAAFAPGAELIAGVVQAVEIKGHTPGHSGYMIRSAKTSLFYVGDTVHHFVVSVRKPEWPCGFDGDPVTAEASRKQVLGAAATSGQLIYAFHFPFPGIGKISGKDGAFSWAPK
jgi:glyoxylase-like metal-dependent hydrolase (beta-lactamase superfamily II)